MQEHTTGVRYGAYEIFVDQGGHEVVLGSSPNAIVYRARDVGLDRPVALKVIEGGAMADWRAGEEFIAEAKTQARLADSDEGPGIVMIYAAAKHGEDVYIAMELCDQGTLDSYVSRHGVLSEGNALCFLLQAALALAYTHRKKFLHLDIKPKNIFVKGQPDGKEPRLKVGDFGLARLLGEGGDQRSPLGTIGYASPEQLRREEVDGRADIFSLGMTIWYLLEGVHPIGSAENQILDERLTPDSYEPRLPTTISGPFRALLAGMLCKSRDDRISNFREVIAQTETCIRQIGGRWESPIVLDESASGGALDDHYSNRRNEQKHELGVVQDAEETATGRPCRIIFPANHQILAHASKVARILAIGNHPHLVDYERKQFDEGVVLIEEYVEGITLVELVRDTGPLRLGDAAPLIRQLADAFDHARNCTLADSEGEPTAIALPSIPESTLVEIGQPPYIEQITAGTACLKIFPKLSLRSGRAAQKPEDGAATMHTLTSGSGMDESLEVSFASLVYWLLAGRPAPELARISVNQYLNIHNLLEDGNRLIKALIVGEPLPGGSFVDFARRLCESEGIALPSGYDPVENATAQIAELEGFASSWESEVSALEGQVNDPLLDTSSAPPLVDSATELGSRVEAQLTSVESIGERLLTLPKSSTAASLPDRLENLNGLLQSLRSRTNEIRSSADWAAKLSEIEQGLHSVRVDLQGLGQSESSRDLDQETLDWIGHPIRPARIEDSLASVAADLDRIQPHRDSANSAREVAIQLSSEMSEASAPGRLVERANTIAAGALELANAVGPTVGNLERLKERYQSLLDLLPGWAELEKRWERVRSETRSKLKECSYLGDEDIDAESFSRTIELKSGLKKLGVTLGNLRQDAGELARQAEKHECPGIANNAQRLESTIAELQRGELNDGLEAVKTAIRCIPDRLSEWVAERETLVDGIDQRTAKHLKTEAKAREVLQQGLLQCRLPDQSQWNAETVARDRSACERAIDEADGFLESLAETVEGTREAPADAAPRIKKLRQKLGSLRANLGTSARELGDLRANLDGLTENLKRLERLVNDVSEKERNAATALESLQTACQAVATATKQPSLNSLVSKLNSLAAAEKAAAKCRDEATALTGEFEKLRAGWENAPNAWKLRVAEAERPAQSHAKRARNSIKQAGQCRTETAQFVTRSVLASADEAQRLLHEYRSTTSEIESRARDAEHALRAKEFDSVEDLKLRGTHLRAVLEKQEQQLANFGDKHEDALNVAGKLDAEGGAIPVEALDEALNLLAEEVAKSERSLAKGDTDTARVKPPQKPRRWLWPAAAVLALIAIGGGAAYLIPILIRENGNGTVPNIPPPPPPPSNVVRLTFDGDVYPLNARIVAKDKQGSTFESKFPAQEGYSIYDFSKVQDDNFESLTFSVAAPGFQEEAIELKRNGVGNEFSLQADGIVLKPEMGAVLLAEGVTISRFFDQVEFTLKDRRRYGGIPPDGSQTFEFDSDDLKTAGSNLSLPTGNYDVIWSSSNPVVNPYTVNDLDVPKSGLRLTSNRVPLAIDELYRISASLTKNDWADDWGSAAAWVGGGALTYIQDYQMAVSFEAVAQGSNKDAMKGYDIKVMFPEPALADWPRDSVYVFKALSELGKEVLTPELEQQIRVAAKEFYTGVTDSPNPIERNRRAEKSLRDLQKKFGAGAVDNQDYKNLASFISDFLSPHEAGNGLREAMMGTLTIAKLEELGEKPFEIPTGAGFPQLYVADFSPKNVKLLAGGKKIEIRGDYDYREKVINDFTAKKINETRPFKQTLTMTIDLIQGTMTTEAVTAERGFKFNYDRGTSVSRP